MWKNLYFHGYSAGPHTVWVCRNHLNHIVISRFVFIYGYIAHCVLMFKHMYSGTYSRGAHAVWVCQKHMHTHSIYYYLVWVKTKDVQTQYQFRHGKKVALQSYTLYWKQCRKPLTGHSGTKINRGSTLYASYIHATAWQQVLRFLGVIAHCVDI